MLCDNCRERDAVIQVTQVTEPPSKQLNLCEKCAAERGIETQLSVPKQPLTDFILAVQQKAVPAEADGIRCSFCQATLRDFKNTGRLGCAYCYGAFEASLRDLLRKVHGGNSKHEGKQYVAPSGTIDEGATVIAELRDRLKRAIDQEHFEEAARLRDQIKVIE